MIWPFDRKSPPIPSAREVEEKSQTVRAREAKKSAVANLLDALRDIEVERDISEALGPRDRKPSR